MTLMPFSSCSPGRPKIPAAAGRGVYPVQKDRRVDWMGAFFWLRSRLQQQSEGLVLPHWSNPLSLGVAHGLASSFRVSWPWRLSSICGSILRCSYNSADKPPSVTPISLQRDSRHASKTRPTRIRNKEWLRIPRLICYTLALPLYY